MSDTNTTKIPSNEEIIDELTKDLKTHCISTDNQEEISENASAQANIPEDFDKSDSEFETDKQKLPDDFIDEVALKDLELSLSEEEKSRRNQEALQLKAKGNEEFKNAQYLESIETYTKALRLCPLKYEKDRAIFYCNRAASKVVLDRKQTAIDDCTKAIELNDVYIRAYLRRAKLYEETEKLDESFEDYKKVLELDPGNKDALSANARLPPLINERNEKLKTEMLGKLKDFGNVILKPFGLSTNNFKLQQDPNSGGYSINFQQNPR